MRENKYKAWDKQTSTLRNVLVIDWANRLVDLSEGIIERKFNEVNLMQSTGATNVYEGYVCKIWAEEPYRNESINTDYDWELVVKVVYKYGAFWFEIIQERGLLIPVCDYLNSDMALMVIGNIYDNPELLEVQT